MPEKKTARQLYEDYKKNPLAGDVVFAAQGSHAAKLLQGQIEAAKKPKGGRRTRRRGARKSRRGKGKGKSRRRGGRSKKCKCSLL